MQVCFCNATDVVFFSGCVSCEFFPVYGFPVFISNVDLFWSQSDRTEFCGKTIFFVKSFCIFISGMIKCHVMVEYLLIRYLGTCHHKTSGTPGTQDLSNIQCQHESMLRSIQSETFCQNSGLETRNKIKEIKLL